MHEKGVANLSNDPGGRLARENDETRISRNRVDTDG